jgi:RNA polymerase sigma-70 factor, ECF subfamily
MNNDADRNGEALEEYRGFLCYLARLHLDPRLSRKLDPEDIVQETLLKAHKAWDSCEAKTPGQVKAWLRTILLRTLARIVEKAREEVNLEHSIHEAIEHSSARLRDYLAAEQTTPGAHAQRNEEALQLEEALRALPDRQREVVGLKHLQGWTLAQISEHLDISTAAVAGLLHRGITELAVLLPNGE